MRKIALFFAALVVTLGFGAPRAEASAEANARALVGSVTGEVIALIQAPGPATGKQAQMRAILDRSADMRQIAGFAVGRYGRSMSDAQKTRYVDLFSRYIAYAYARRFGEYGGQRIDIIEAIDAGRKGVVVRTVVEQGNGQRIRIDWQVDERGGRPLIADLQVEGVSLAVSQRDEFTSMLNERGGNVDAFLDELARRIGG